MVTAQHAVLELATGRTQDGGEPSFSSIIKPMDNWSCARIEGAG
jgi:hypothetical protein